MKTKDNNFLISVEKTFGFDSTVNQIIRTTSDTARWNGVEKVKDIILKGVLEFVGNDQLKTFAPKDIIRLLQPKYQDINISTIRCQIIQDCVNHTSRKHYPSGQQDRYFLIEKGVYRLYDLEKDGKWNWEGKSI